MDTHGFHLLLDIWTNESITDSLTERLKNYVRNNFTVVREAEKKFELGLGLSDL